MAFKDSMSESVTYNEGLSHLPIQARPYDITVQYKVIKSTLHQEASDTVKHLCIPAHYSLKS